MAATFCLINQKGGCGKSSTCFHLAGAFAELGLYVLLLDMDPQGSLSQGFLGSEFVESLRSQETISMLFDDNSAFEPRDTLLRATPFDRITICPANHMLARFNLPEPEKTGMQQYAIQEFLTEQSGFDIVLIDCPPNLYRCSWTSMVAADYVLIPVPPEDFGTQGLRAVHQCIEQARQLNPTLRLLGHLITRRDKRLLVHRMYEQKLREMYGEMVMTTAIPEASAFKVALTRRRPVAFHDRRSKAAKLTLCLAREILDRIDMEERKRRIA
ncbi:MinD/ParA/CobQ/CobA-like protein [Stieleria magnilauensis]|uniref:MinD/ParA/CobQ/CobA-like protein n=2 Tax=Stieleria magnilauensis TaxID=2527963 RepID=A0ABX5XPW2_9BACT|nr:MinD/ParA/CobQ/CobA-like protein [Planctomycetes bacterium TBK1r]